MNYGIAFGVTMFLLIGVLLAVAVIGYCWGIPACRRRKYNNGNGGEPNGEPEGQ